MNIILFWLAEAAGAVLVIGLTLILLGLRQVNAYAAAMREDREERARRVWEPFKP